MGKKGFFLPLPPPPSFIFWLSFDFSRGQKRKSPTSVFLCSEIKRKRLLRRRASCKCCQQQRLRSRWALFICSVLCHVNLLERTVFENICFPSLPYINFYLLLDKIGLARKSRVRETTLGYSCIVKTFLLWNSAKHPVHNSDVVLLYIHRLAQWIFNNYSASWAIDSEAMRARGIVVVKSN